MKFDELIKQIKKCRHCESSFGFIPNPIIWGHANSKIVQISQAPSKSVHESGKPFTDASGKTLRNDWYQITEEDFYNNDNFYISALAHCYPGKQSDGKSDKQPPKCCYKMWIQKELELINNEIYIIIGSASAKIFFPDEKFEDLIFKDNILNGKKAIVLPHPSPLNSRWIKSHPEFLNKRIKEVRKTIYNLIYK